MRARRARVPRGFRAALFRGCRRRRQHNATRDDGEEPTSRETLESVARYVASLAEELAAMAQRNGLDTLSYILEMARLEADQIAKD